jgi:hypothetical protein
MKHLSFKIWLSIFLYAICAGLLIQLLVLPHIFPQLHAGNGLLAGRDWVGFHEQAVIHAQQIVRGGWGEFLLRPDGDNAIIGVTAFFYVIFEPEPWALLPLSAAMFATGGMALFSMLKFLDLEDSEASIALLPYLFFPSALLQYGQIHKDVFCTAGVLLILWACVGLLRKERKLSEVFPLLAISAFALILVSVFRPYFMLPFLGLGLVLLVWHVLRMCWQLAWVKTQVNKKILSMTLKFNFQSFVIVSVLCAFSYVMSVSYLDLRFRAFGPSGEMSSLWIPVFTFHSNDKVRSADTARLLRNTDEAALLKSIQECQPIVILKDDAFIENMINRAFLKIAVARAGFTSSGGTTVASNIDKGIDFCKNEDLISYIPRAMQIALFAPFPSKWFSTEKRNSSSVEIYISAVEMLYSYVACIGLLYWLFSYRLWRIELLLPVTCALGLILLLGLVVANVGTLYRMRFPMIMIFISFGMAGLMQMAKIRPRWLERLELKDNR